MESSCCHHVICRDCCSNLRDCPLCRHVDVQFTPSPLARRMISDMPVTCDYDCGAVLTRGTLKSHMEACTKRPLKCPDPQCVFSGVGDAILEHIMYNHKELFMSNYTYLFNASPVMTTRPSPPTTNDDIIQKRNNKNHRLARLGSTGKFYCGGKLDFQCGCCNGSCGPTNGKHKNML